ncbi:MAG: peptidoglycan-binding domain-containing protein [Cardiobacteriaceae bacterium]|nr:peptidoglycan-binding domain-containing protein [Cardiobacteriaceae bacterium]
MFHLPLKALCRTLPLWLMFMLPSAHAAYDCAKHQGSMAFAAHSGHLDVLKKHKQQGCAFRADERGFTLHDFATLSGETKTQQWLSQNKADTKPSKALIRLVQAGLRQLGHDAGPIDGVLSSKTEKAILAYQKQHKLKQNKNLKGAWLSHFYRNLMKKVQSALVQQGYKIGKVDGLLGRDTRSALIAYRQKKNLSPKQYAYLDETIVRHVLSGQNATTRSPKAATAKALAKNQAQSKVPKANQTAKSSAQKPSKVVAPKVVPQEPEEVMTPDNGIRLVRDGQIVSHKTPVPPTESPKRPNAKNNDNHQAIHGNFRTISGKLNISANRCQIGGQSIDHEWCQSHSDRNGRSCSAVIDRSGKVYNLLCK